MRCYLLTLAFMLLTYGQRWKMVPVARGRAVFYTHTTTSVDAEINPWTRSFLALQGDWDRRPYPVMVQVDGRWASASRRDVTRSRYVAEFSAALCGKLRLDYGHNGGGVAYGTWDVEVFEVRRVEL